MTYTIDRLPYHTGELLMIYRSREYIGSVEPVGEQFCGKPFVCQCQIFSTEEEAIEFVKDAEILYQAKFAGVAA